MALDLPHLGYVVRETADKIVVFGEANNRYDIPKSEIQMTGRNVLVGLSAYEIAKKYKVMHEAPLPTTTPVEHWSQGENIILQPMKENIQNPYLIKELGQTMKTMSDI